MSTTSARSVYKVLSFSRRRAAFRGEAVDHDKHKRRGDGEQEQREAVYPIRGLHPPRRGPVLLHGQRGHIAVKALVDVAGGRVVDRVCVAPLVERGEGEETKEDARRFVGPPRLEERAVTAVMKDDEGADPESGGKERDGQHEPERNTGQVEHHGPEQEEWHERVDHLPGGASAVRLGEGGNQLLPVHLAGRCGASHGGTSCFSLIIAGSVSRITNGPPQNQPRRFCALPPRLVQSTA